MTLDSQGPVSQMYLFTVFYSCLPCRGESFDVVQALLSNTQNTAVLSRLLQSQIQYIAIYRLLWRKKNPLQPDPNTAWAYCLG